MWTYNVTALGHCSLGRKPHNERRVFGRSARHMPHKSVRRYRASRPHPDKNNSSSIASLIASLLLAVQSNSARRNLGGPSVDCLLVRSCFCSCLGSSKLKN